MWWYKSSSGTQWCGDCGAALDPSKTLEPPKTPVYVKKIVCPFCGSTNHSPKEKVCDICGHMLK